MRRILSERDRARAIFPIVVRRAGMLVVGLMLLFCGTARAGTYEVWSCADEAGKPAAIEGWAKLDLGPTAIGDSGQVHANGCATSTGLYVGFNGTTISYHAAAGWTFTAPADTTLAAYRIWRSMVSIQAPGNITISRIGPGPSDEQCASTAGCVALGTERTPFADANLLRVDTVPAGKTVLTVRIQCDSAGDNCAATGGAQVAARVYRLAVVLRDDSAPAFLSPPGGSLTAAGALTGTQSISFSAADKGGGVRSGVLEVDGAAVARQEFCAPPYAEIVPCNLADGGTLSVDTRTLADGPHSARVVVTDAGGNVAASEPIAFTTANAPTACSPDAAPAFSVGFDHGKGTIALGGKLSVRGTLGGVPAGTTLLLNSQVDRAGAPVKFGRTPLTVDAAGRFSYRVPAGPSRTLRFAQTIPGASTFACSAPLKVNVKASTSLTASPRAVRPGGRVRFKGRLKGGYVPEGGKVVELQAHERGRWRTITTLRTDAKGAFSYRYRFSFRAAGTTFPVRVRIRHEGTYPFALGYSKRVKVRVR
jgi:hypothetical protein